MTDPPTRWLDGSDLSADERALLEAAQRIPPVRYDVVAGAARFEQTLEALGASSAVGSAKVLHLGASKLALLLVPALGVGAYLAQRSITPTSAPAATVTPALQTVVDVSAAPPTANVAAPNEIVDASGERTIDAHRDPAPIATPDRARRRPMHSQAEARGGASVGDGKDPSVTATHAAHSATDTSRAMDVRETNASPHVEAPEIEAPSAQAPAGQTPAAHTPQAPNDEPSIDELRGIAQARAALASDPERALSLLQQVARAHPKGYFGEEREALTILALVGVGEQDKARQRGLQFLRRSPRSPFATRVRAAIAR